METLKDRNVQITIALFTGLTIVSALGQSEQSLVNQALNIVISTAALVVNVLFLKYLTNGVKVNRKAPYNETPFNAWSYIWRILIVYWLLPMSLLPLALFIPLSMMPIIGSVWLILVNNLLIFLLYCRQKQEKMVEMKAFVAGFTA